MSIFAPIQLLADWLTYTVFSLNEGTRLAESVNFFIYDSLKILLLLLAINFIMAIIRFYLPIEKIRDFLRSRKWYGIDYFLAASFGALTPFCSCSSIPLFVGFLRAGIPIGVTFTFLITSPLINEAAIALFIGFFGLKLTVYYVVAGLTIGILGGFALSRINVKKHINSDILEIGNSVKIGADTRKQMFASKTLLKLWLSEAFSLTKKLLPYVLIGVGIGALIHGYVPQNFFETTLSNSAWWTVPLATIVAVPLYSNAVAVIPIMGELVTKGVPIGTAIAFMMATVGLSLPEALMLKKIMSMRLLVTFFGVVSAGIIVIGWIMNILS